MKKLTSILAIAIIIAASITACSKYEEGPKLSLRSKKARLAGDWLLESISLNGTVVTTGNTTDFVTFKKDGTCSQTWNSITVSGTWEFMDGKDKIITTYNNTKDTSDLIIRLTNKELWFKDVNGSNTSITKFKAK